jgi:hypothetical protein
MGLASGKSWKMRTRRKKKEATFPAQALSCSGSTGIISAKSTPLHAGMLQHPGNFRKPVFRRQYKDM